MTDTIAKVLEFHEAFGCEISERPDVPDCHHGGSLAAIAAMLRTVLTDIRYIAANDMRALRIALITEELTELVEACSRRRTADALDALVDLRYVLDGTVIAFGMHVQGELRGRNRSVFEVAFDRVHSANMAKLLSDGTPVRDSTGKVIKPVGWTPPDLSDLVV